MSRDRGRRALEIFESLIDIEPERIDAEVESRCAGDADLRSDVLNLLRAREDTLSMLQSPPAEALPPSLVGEVHADGARTPLAYQRGDVIDRYEIRSVLGEGGFGVVYKAHQEQPVKRDVALKIIKPGMDSRAVVARFEAERQALAVMNHPNVARVIDGGTTPDGRPYFVMELALGQPITEYCDRVTMSIPDRLELFARVCDAVQHAHQKGIIHRDIKPSNILVVEQDGTPAPKVIDFGIAKALDQSQPQASMMTLAGAMIGTPAYMSPEQAGMGGGDIDTRSDVYSLGVLLYELLSGTLPFQKESLYAAGLAEIQRIICEHDPPRPSTRLSALAGATGEFARTRRVEREALIKHLRGDLDWIVMKCLEKDRARRYESAANLGDDIRRVLRSEPVEARPPSAGYRIQKFVRRNRGLVVSAAAIMLVCVVATLVSVWFAIAANNEAHDRLIAEQKATAGATAALTAQGVAERRANDALYESYIANIGAAMSASEAYETARSTTFLERCPEQLRGWEWDFLRAQNDMSLLSIEHNASWIEEFADGSRIAMTNQAEIQIRDRRTFEVLGACVGHQGSVQMFRFSADGTRIASASPDGDVIIWSADTYELEKRLRHGEHVTYVDFDSTGRRLVTATITNNVRIWDIDTNEVLLMVRADGNGCYSCDFSPDDATILTSAWGGVTQLWDAATGALLATYRPPGGFAYNSAFSSDGTRVCVAVDETIHILDATLTKRFVIMRGHTAPLAGVRFVEDDSRVISYGDDGTIRIWNVHDGSLHRVLPGHTHRIDYAMMTRDGERIFSASRDHTVRSWLTRNPSFLADQTAPVAVHPQGRMIAVMEEGVRVRIMDSQTYETLRALPVNAHALDFHPSQDHILVGVHAGDLEVWSTTSGERLQTLSGHTAHILHARWSHDGKRIVSASWDRTVRIWDAATGDELARFDTPRWCNSVTFGPDDERIYAACADNNVYVWDVTPDAEPMVLRRHAWTVESIDFSPDGTRFVTGSNDETAVIWDARTHTPQHVLNGHTQPLRAADWHPDGTRLATAGLDGTVRIWDTATGRELCVWRSPTPNLMALKFTVDGTRLIAGGLLDGSFILDTVSTRDRAAALEERQAQLEEQ